MLPNLNLKYGLCSNTVIPYIIVRSALFSSRIFRGNYERPTVNVPTKIEMVGRSREMPQIFQISGRQLDQSDAEVFYEVINELFTNSNIGPGYTFSVDLRSLVAKLGRQQGGKTNALLVASLNRLNDVSFSLRNNGGHEHLLRLLRTSIIPLAPRRIEIQVDVSLVNLFSHGAWALLRKNERCALASPVARAVYAYYQSHSAHPHPHKYETILRLVGREGVQESKAIKLMADALAQIKQATGWKICELATSGKYAGNVLIEKAYSCQRQAKIALLPNVKELPLGSVDI